AERSMEAEFDLIQGDPSIKEVILSGGDPLSLSNPQLKNLLLTIDGMQHVQRIRFHTRFPIGIPERIDDSLLNMLGSFRCQVWLIVHANHPHELDHDVLAALKKIQKLGICVLNQWVLLKGVNDQLDTLQQLCEKLVDAGIFPYYLHQLDRAAGTAHFEVSEDRGRELIQSLNNRLAGYAVPKYVREIPAEPSKTLLMPITDV